jgi:hypothetical protein
MSEDQGLVVGPSGNRALNLTELVGIILEDPDPIKF